MKYDIDIKKIEGKLIADEFSDYELRLLEKLTQAKSGSIQSFNIWTDGKRTDVVGCFVSDVYEQYTSFCKLTKIEPLNKIKFSMAICKKYQVQSKVVSYNSRSRRIYASIY